MAPRLRATFRNAGDAGSAVRDLRQQGVSAEDIVVDDTGDRQHMLVRQQQQEVDGAKQLPVDLVSPAQAKGAARGAAGGALVGAVLVGLVGVFVSLGDFSRPAGIALFAVVGALAGASAGFVYGGGRQPELDGELHDPTADTTVAVTPSSPEQAAAAIRTIDESAATDAEYETDRGDPLADDGQ
jgi:hypothetical protein